MVEPEKNDPPPKNSWIENLAKRSTGLPENQPASRHSGSTDASLWSLAGLGIQFALVVALFAYAGHWLDERMGWSPWGVISLTMIALIGSLHLLIKQARKGDQQPPPKGRDRH